MQVDIIADGRHQFFDIAEDAAAEPVLGKVAEEALDHVQPGTAGGREIDVESRMAVEPLFDLGVLVGRVVVHDHVDLLLRRGRVVDHAQELQPFLMAVAVVAHGDHLAIERVERPEQSRHAIALVVVSHGSAAGATPVASGPGPVSGFFHRRIARWRTRADSGTAHDGFQFLREADVPAEFEGADAA